jgi:translation initiation factor 4E
MANALAEYLYKKIDRMSAGSKATQAEFSNPFAYLNEVGSGELSDILRSENGGASLSPVLSTPTNEKTIEASDSVLSAPTLCDMDEETRATKITENFGARPHKLPKAWTFWYLKPPTGSKSNFTNYESLLKKIGSFETAEEFWALYLSLKRPSELYSPAGTTDISLFLQDVHPTWEDENNAQGGKLMLRFKKHGDTAAYYYEALVLLLVGGTFPFLDEVTGIVLSIRAHESILSFWTRHAADMAAIQKLRDYVKAFFGLPPNTTLEYKPHNYAKPAPAH